MDLTVHIGTTKTGSTSIQNFLSLNRAALRATGIFVPTCLWKEIHLKAVLASLPYGESPDLGRVFHLYSPEVHSEFRTTTVSEFQAEVAGAQDCHTGIITAEQFHSRMSKIKDIETFKHLFCGHFPKTKIVVYVRPQLDQVVSLYTTMLRGDYANPLNAFIKSRMARGFDPYFDLKDVITRWAAVFGAENVIVRPYKAALGGFGTLGDFAGILGIDIAASDWVMPEKTNPSINAQGQDLLRIVNEAGGLDRKGKKKLITWLEANCRGKSEAPDLALAHAFQDRFRESNDWVIAQYFPDHPEYLEPNWPAE